jgi:hypothetical protein
MNSIKLWWAAAVLATSLLVVGSCVDPKDQWIVNTEKDLDPVAKGLDDWGTASMSNPLLTTPDSAFSFDLKRSGQDYYNDARNDINGGAGISQEQALQSLSGLQFKDNVEQNLQASAALASGGVAGLLAVDKPTTAPAIASNVLPTTLPSSSVFSAEKFAAFQALLQGSNLVLDDRTAIVLASGNKATQDILAYLTGPTTTAKFKDKLVLLGTAMVSVQPGSRTYTGYAAELVITTDYEPELARQDLVTQIPVSDRIELYKRCLVKNWQDAKKPPEGVSQTDATSGYENARANFAKVLLSEARKLTKGPGVAIDTTPLYKAAVAKPDAKSISELAIKPPEPATLFALAEKIDKLSASGKIQVVTLAESTDKSVLDVDRTPIDTLKGSIASAQEYGQFTFADTLRTAVKTLEQQIEDATAINETLDSLNLESPLKNESATAGKESDVAAATPGTYKSTLSLTAEKAGPIDRSLGRFSGRIPKPDEPKEEENDAGQAAPFIAAISPMSDSQILDLRESVRNQRERATQLALALSFAGADAQAQAFRDYANRNQEDVATLSGDNVELAYSTGDVFGFQVSPRLKAIANFGATDNGKDNNEAKKKAAMILDPISFPVLIIVGMDQEDIRLFPGKDTDGIYKPFEYLIRFRQTTRWLPLGDPNNPLQPPARLTETQRGNWAADLRRAEDEIDKHSHDEDPYGWIDTISNRQDFLEKTAIDDWNSQYTPANMIVAAYAQPATAAPQVSAVVPSRVQLPMASAPTTQPVVIVGSGFKNLDASTIKAIVVGSDTVSVDVYQPKVGGDSAITLGLVPHGQIVNPLPVYFTLDYKSDTGEDKVLITPPTVLENFDATSLKISRATTRDAKGVTSDHVEFSPQIDPALLDRYLKGPTTQPVWVFPWAWPHKQGPMPHDRGE